MTPATKRLRLHAFLCGVEQADFAFVDPLDERAGTAVESPDFLYAIEHPQGLVVVDSGVHPQMAAAMGEQIRWSPEDSVRARLASIGATVADVRFVVQTHLHYDHAGGLPELTGIPVIVQEAELAFARNPPVYQRDFFHPPDFEGEVEWQPISGEHDLFGDGRILIVPTPGHTPGHQSVLVSLERVPVLLAGDIHYSLEKMAERRLSAVVWSPDEMVASWIRAENLASERGARLLITHEIGYREDVRLAPDEWYE